MTLNMKSNKIIAAALIAAAMPLGAHAWDWQSVLGGLGKAAGQQQSEQTTGEGKQSGLGGLLGGIIDGVFSTSNLTVKDIAGTWKVKGSAVSFQSENFLSQAGGKAAASMIEKKIDPYYKKLGLTGGTLTINEDGTFALKGKKLTLKGTVEAIDPVTGKVAGSEEAAAASATAKTNAKSAQASGSKPNFVFTFQALGTINIGIMDAYVTKTPSGLDIMYDASKLMSMIETIASVSKIQGLQTISSLLNSYDGLCIGYHLTK